MNGDDGDTIVIVGGGQAADQVVASLRQGGSRAPISIFGEEDHLPYQRPPLSKAYLAGDLPLERLYFRSDETYTQSDVKLHLGTQVTGIDRQARTIDTGHGETFSYSKLILATGSRVRRIVCDGARLGNIHYLRNIADVDRLAPHLRKSRRLAIVGAGYVGLEVAAVAATLGLAVTVIDIARRVLSRVAGEKISSFFEGIHRSAGVEFRLENGIGAFEGGSNVEAIRFEDGSSLATDFVLVGIGILPNEELAQSAGLKTENGIWVDEYAQTEDPNIYAIGDCTYHPNAPVGRRLRLESVHNAVEQAKAAAASICGTPKPYAQFPWFWSDQYDVKLQTVGLSQGADLSIVRGDPSARRFAVFYLKDGMLIAVDAVNSAAEFMSTKLLLAEGITPDPGVLADAEVSLKSYLKR